MECGTVVCIKTKNRSSPQIELMRLLLLIAWLLQVLHRSKANKLGFESLTKQCDSSQSRIQLSLRELLLSTKKA